MPDPNIAYGFVVGDKLRLPSIAHDAKFDGGYANRTSSLPRVPLSTEKKNGLDHMQKEDGTKPYNTTVASPNTMCSQFWS